MARNRITNQELDDFLLNAGTLDQRQSGTVGALSAASFESGTPPAKASAAPVSGTQNIFKGLTTALNLHQQDLVKQKKRAIPDQYEIVFEPAIIGESTVTLPGPQNATTAPMQNNNTAKKLDNKENSVNRSARTWPVPAGTQIIKVIDDVIRNSSYITDQQNVEISSTQDPVTGLQTQKINAKAGTGNMLWYKISVNVKDLGFDTIIRDYAYRMSFIITPYAVAQMVSQYFPDSRYRGVHKAYNYWFTGANTQILNYEQSYNNAYRLALSGIGADTQKKLKTDFRDQNRFVYTATSEDQSTGAKNYANDPGNQAASFLYDPRSLSTVKMTIIGDPAWLQQGEIGLGVNARTFDFRPFGADGSINYDSTTPMFSVAFNTPADYDFATGLVNVNANNRAGKPQEYYTFQAIECKSVFSKGRFTQELQGKLLVEKQAQPPTSNGRANIAGSNVAAGSRTTGTPNDGSLGSEIVDETGQVSNLRRNEYGDLYDPAGTAGSALPSPQRAKPPQPATSTGDIRTNTPSTEFGFEDAFAPVTLRPRRNFGTTDIDFADQSALVPTRPQIIARDD